MSHALPRTVRTAPKGRAPLGLSFRATPVAPGRSAAIGGAVGRLFVERCLSAGPESSIYAIRRPGRGPEALKVIDLRRTPRADVSRAFALQRRCHGPLTAAARALHIAHPWAFWVMERPLGPALEDDLARDAAQGQLVPLGITLQRFALMAQAAALCHDRGVVHRDVKPGNFVLAESRGISLKLIDFALATERASASGAGTTLYLAPEALKGAPCHPSQDVWALGIALFRMVTGIEPHYADDEALAAAQIIAAAPSFTTGDLALYLGVHTSHEALIEGTVALYQAACQADPKARPQATLLAQQASRLAAVARGLG